MFLNCQFVQFCFCLNVLDRNSGADLDMGKSSFPEGDMDPLRAHERISKTTNDIFFGNVSQTVDK